MDPGSGGSGRGSAVYSDPTTTTTAWLSNFASVLGLGGKKDSPQQQFALRQLADYDRENPQTKAERASDPVRMQVYRNAQQKGWSYGTTVGSLEGEPTPTVYQPSEPTDWEAYAAVLGIGSLNKARAAKQAAARAKQLRNLVKGLGKARGVVGVSKTVLRRGGAYGLAGSVLIQAAEIAAGAIGRWQDAAIIQSVKQLDRANVSNERLKRASRNYSGPRPYIPKLPAATKPVLPSVTGSATSAGKPTSAPASVPISSTANATSQPAGAKASAQGNPAAIPSVGSSNPSPAAQASAARKRLDESIAIGGGFGGQRSVVSWPPKISRKSVNSLAESLGTYLRSRLSQKPKERWNSLQLSPALPSVAAQLTASLQPSAMAMPRTQAMRCFVPKPRSRTRSRKKRRGKNCSC